VEHQERKGRIQRAKASNQYASGAKKPAIYYLVMTTFILSVSNQTVSKPRSLDVKACPTHHCTKVNSLKIEFKLVFWKI